MGGLWAGLDRTHTHAIITYCTDTITYRNSRAVLIVLTDYCWCRIISGWWRALAPTLRDLIKSAHFAHDDGEFEHTLSERAAHDRRMSKHEFVHALSPSANRYRAFRVHECCYEESG